MPARRHQQQLQQQANQQPTKAKPPVVLGRMVEAAIKRTAMQKKENPKTRTTTTIVPSSSHSQQNKKKKPPPRKFTPAEFAQRLKRSRTAIPATAAPNNTPAGQQEQSQQQSQQNQQQQRRRRRNFTPAEYAAYIKHKFKHRKRYRRYKQIRPCVFPMVFTICCGIIALERYLGYQLRLEDFQQVYYEQIVGNDNNDMDPWSINNILIPPRQRIGAVPDILNLTFTPRTLQCPTGQRRMINLHNPQVQAKHFPNKKIPMIIHQTSQTRCLTRILDQAVIKWAFRGWSYYFHDDAAVDRLLLDQIFPEFPQLQVILHHCTTFYDASHRSTKSTLWKFLVLWVYGGLYADLNTYPTRFDKTTLQETDDGFFLLEENLQNQKLVLSTKLMAVSPRHPLIYYTIQHYLHQIITGKGTNHYTPAGGDGQYSLPISEALQRALVDFQSAGARLEDASSNSNNQTVIHNSQTPTTSMTTTVLSWPMTVHGAHGRSIRIAGIVHNDDDEKNDKEGYITPVFKGQAGWQREMDKMGMHDRLGEEPMVSDHCLRDIWNSIVH